MKVGSTHQARTNMPWQGKEGHFADIRILDARQERLGQITAADAKAEGGYTLLGYRVAFERIYGKWDPDQLVWIIDFKKVG